jgi:DNA-binding YbaB/EbfC family protein
MNPPDMKKLLDQAREMQSRMNDLQRELAARRFEASSGGGMITATASGALRIIEIRIEPDIFESGDLRMIQDLTSAAVNAALEKAQRWAQEEFQKLSAGGLPLGGPLNPGGLH